MFLKILVNLIQPTVIARHPAFVPSRSFHRQVKYELNRDFNFHSLLNLVHYHTTSSNMSGSSITSLPCYRVINARISHLTH